MKWRQATDSKSIRNRYHVLNKESFKFWIDNELIPNKSVPDKIADLYMMSCSHI